MPAPGDVQDGYSNVNSGTTGWPGVAHAPVRKLSRLGNELFLTSSLAIGALVPGRHPWAVVLLQLLGRCAMEWVEGDTIRPPATPVQGMSIHAMAAALHRPYATIHRYIHGLAAEGLIVRVAAGYAVSNGSDTAPRIVALLTLAHDTVLRLAEDVAVDMDLPAAGNDHDRIRRTVLAALDIWLIPLEYAREPVGNWVSMVVWIAVVVANVRHILLDPVLTEQFARTPTPDALRRPISGRQIARITGLPSATVARHCTELAARDVLRYERDGWVMLSRQLFDAEVDQGVHALLGYFRKRIVELTSCGLDPARAGPQYLAARPPYIPIEPKIA